MIVAKLTDGTLLLGLSGENIKRLQMGQPIRITRHSHGVELPESMPRIAIMYGDTETTIQNELVRVFGRTPSECDA